MAEGFFRRVLSPAMLGTLLFFSACSSPPDPPEIKFAEVLHKRLIKAEAPAYDEEGFRRYMASTQAARAFFEEERRPGLRVTTRREEASSVSWAWAARRPRAGPVPWPGAPSAR